MSLNIKSEETHRLVRELAHLTGESQTAAVTSAVREKLERVISSPNVGMAERLLAIGADCAKRLGDPIDHGDFLYGADGLPK